MDTKGARFKRRDCFSWRQLGTVPEANCHPSHVQWFSQCFSPWANFSTDGARSQRINLERNNHTVLREIPCLATLVLCLVDNIPIPQPQPHHQCLHAHQEILRLLIAGQLANTMYETQDLLLRDPHQGHPKVQRPQTISVSWPSAF